MAGIDNNVLFGSNVDFSGGFPVSGEININGELLVGASVAPFIRPYVPTGSNGLVVNTGLGTLDFSLANIPNSALQHNTITLSAGIGLIGGGTIPLGGVNSISVNGALQISDGFATWGGAGNYFDDTTLGSFTVLRPGTGYIGTVPVSWTAPQTITGLLAGNCYLIYMDSNGIIRKAIQPNSSILESNVPLFNCLRDSTSPSNNQITVRENHPFNMPVAVYNYLDAVVGTVIENDNNGANITLNGTQKIQINGSDVLSDNGLTTNIPDSAGVAVAFHKMYTNAGGLWAQQNATDTFSGFYNNAGTPTALGANKFGVYTLYVSKDNLNSSSPTYYAVLDTQQYNNQTAANNAISAGTTARATNELAELELAQLGFITYGQLANAITNVIVAKATLKQIVSSGGGGGTVTAVFGTVDRITSTGGITPVIDIAATYVGQASITTLGTISSGTWNGGIIGGTWGGTGVNNGASTITLGGSLTTSGAFASTFTMTNTTTVTFPTTGTLATTSQLPSITATQYDVLVGGAANAVISVGPGSAGQVLQSGGNAANPAYSTATYPATAGTSGNILTSNGTNWISAVPSGVLVWSIITADQTAAINNAYICNKGTLLTLTMPGTAAVGSVIGVTNMNIAAGTKVLSANPGQLILGTSTATANTGSYTSTQLGDSLIFVCTVANTTWQAYSVVGNWTVA